MVEDTLVVATCHCTVPDPVRDVASMLPWCGNCGRDIHRDTLEALDTRKKQLRDAQEADAKDLLYSLGAP